MSSKHTLQQTNEFAPHYDTYIEQTSWYGPQMLFGLMYERIKPDENLLDLGIGTGISSLPFNQAGLNIYGVDGSEEMIKLCQKKGFTEEVRAADLAAFKSPFKLAIFDHVISIGVLHLVGNLGSVFTEVSRSLRKGGLFGFTTVEFRTDHTEGYLETSTKGIYGKANPETGIMVYQHTNAYILEMLKLHEFNLWRQTEFLAYKDNQSHREYHFAAYIAEKK